MANGFLPEQPVIPPSFEVPPIAPEEESGLEADENAREQLAETEETFLETEEANAPTTQTTPPAGAVAAPSEEVHAVKKDEVLVEVEKILEDGLGEYFDQLPENAKARFQTKGKEVASQIAIMVRGFHVQVKKVVLLIHNWLLTIPGVNKFFLEQEAKIKTDRILELEQIRREEAKKQP